MSLAKKMFKKKGKNMPNKSQANFRMSLEKVSFCLKEYKAYTKFNFARYLILIFGVFLLL